MVEVGGEPILRHIMQIYAEQGFSEFVVALGYLSHVVKRWFLEQITTSGDMEIDLRSGGIRRDDPHALPWRVRLIETGLHTQTGGRLKRLAPVLNGKAFMLTYGDGVANVDLGALIEFHKQHKRLATVTAVRPPARFGALDLNGDRVMSFTEKPQLSEGWINGGFMVLEPAVLDGIDGDDVVLERDVLSQLASVDQLRAYRHTGFWHCMDTLRDVRMLDELARKEHPPWRRS